LKIADNSIDGWRGSTPLEVGHGIYVKSDYCSITGNKVIRKAYHGIMVVGNRNHITDNDVVDADYTNSNTYSGIYVQGDFNFVDGNHSESSVVGQRQKYGIYIYSGQGNILGVNMTSQNMNGNVFDGGTNTRGWTGDGLSRRIRFDSAAPTTGTWTQGDIVFAKSPTAGGKAGWTCVTSGSPGTWKGFGVIDA
jgi:parallel beta-helix repeat protein